MSLFLEERRPSEPLDFLLRLQDKCFIVVTQESARGGKGFANQFDQANFLKCCEMRIFGRLRSSSCGSFSTLHRRISATLFRILFSKPSRL